MPDTIKELMNKLFLTKILDQHSSIIFLWTQLGVRDYFKMWKDMQFCIDHNIVITQEQCL